ncbi:MAG TPA: phosphate ABC transporter substrate-binding protein PstS [Bdellovibrionota bacterium]|jgi:phosphate transport system substrate-binding protein
MKNLFLLFALSFASPSVFAATQLNGAGATFPFPLYSKWFDEYRKVKPEVTVNYNSIGSGGGIKALLEGTVDFGASDAPMNEEEMKKSKSPVVHVPTVLGADVISYNLPEVTKRLRLSGDVIADIYLGKITKWNDPRIVAMNKGVTMPDKDILVAYRSDGSGTTYIFTDYLSKVSAEWKEKVGTGKSVSWPVGIAGKGNEGVAGLIKQSEGSLGYVELIYAASNKLTYADIKNKAGEFVSATPETVTASAAGALKSMPSDFRVSITNAEGKKSYPISSFTYLLVPSTLAKEHGKEIVDLLHWVISPSAQKMAGPLEYAPLPSGLVSKVKAKVGSIKVE